MERGDTRVSSVVTFARGERWSMHYGRAPLCMCILLCRRNIPVSFDLDKIGESISASTAAALLVVVLLPHRRRSANNEGRKKNERRKMRSPGERCCTKRAREQRSSGLSAKLCMCVRAHGTIVGEEGGRVGWLRAALLIAAIVTQNTRKTERGDWRETRMCRDVCCCDTWYSIFLFDFMSRGVLVCAGDIGSGHFAVRVLARSIR